MKIAYVINSTEGGGAALPVPAIASALRGAGAVVEILALTRRDGRAIAPMEAAGLTVHVRQGGKKDHLNAIRWLNSEISRIKPHAIWTSLTRATLLGQLVGARLRIPVVSWQHAAYLRPENLRLLRLMRNRSVLWVADSECVAEFSRNSLKIDPARLVVWPIFSADPDAPQAKPPYEEEAIRIATLGRLHPVKGHDVLIDALSILKMQDRDARPHFRLTIAGEGDERARLEAAIATAGLENVELPGFVDDPRAFLASQHVYVQPSRSEGFCVAAHEAMQAGLPVIGSSVGEMKHTIEHGKTGLLVSPGNAVELAAAIGSILDSPASIGVMGQAARERLLQRFDEARFNRIARQIVERLDGFSR